MSFAGRAGKALKGEAGVAECLFDSTFAAISYKHRAGRASCGNVAENALVPQFRLCGRGECVIKYNCLYGSSCAVARRIFFFPRACFPVEFCFQNSNIRTGFMQYKIIFPTVFS